MTAEFIPTSVEGSSPLPGRPVPYFLEAGQGEHAHLFDQLFTVLLSKDETDGQFGVFTSHCPKGQAIPVHAHADVHEIFFVVSGQIRVWTQDPEGERLEKLLGPGDFGYVPARVLHTFRVEADGTRTLGVCTGGFERFFAAAGTRASAAELPQPPYVPATGQLLRAAQDYRNEFHFDLRLDR